MTVITDELTELIDQHAEPVCKTDAMSYEDWLLQRKPYLGASEAAASIGLSPYESPMALWINKTTDESSDVDTDYTRWGRRLEEAIGLGISEDTGIPVERFPYMMRSREWPWMSVNVDFLSGEYGDFPASVVEVKNVSERNSAEWLDGAVPEHYGLQGQHACAVLGLPGVHFFPLIGGHDPRPIYVERDDALIESLVEGERKFWELVESMTPPAMDASESTNRVLKRFYANSEADTYKEIPPESIHLLRERAAAKQVIKDQESYVKEIENQLMGWLGTADHGTVNGITVVTWKKTKDREGFWVEPRPGNRLWNVPKGSPALEPAS